jgi:hypothetical protein
MIEIKAGAELDAAVAEACGIKGAIEQMELPNGELTRGLFCISDGNMADDQYWSPSTDLDAAFDAGKRSGLLGPFKAMLIPTIEGWRVDVFAHVEGKGFRNQVASKCDSLPLAICAAIIKLRENATEGK